VVGYYDGDDGGYGGDDDDDGYIDANAAVITGVASASMTGYGDDDYDAG